MPHCELKWEMSVIICSVLKLYRCLWSSLASIGAGFVIAFGVTEIRWLLIVGIACISGMIYPLVQDIRSSKREGWIPTIVTSKQKNGTRKTELK